MHGETALTVGSLFSGIGGIELGLEAAGGFRTIWNCEIEPYPSAVLAERWPEIPNLGDITKVDWSGVEKPDVLCGGFPCQDISQAGKRAGIGGKKSGLWKEYLRAIRELRPRYAVIENVAALVGRGLDVVLTDLAALGYDAEWEIISAADVEAHQNRSRLFLIAYSHSRDGEKSIRSAVGIQKQRCIPKEKSPVWQSVRSFADFRNLLVVWNENQNSCRERGMADGLPRGLDSFIWKERIRALGNAVVPQVAERVGRAILRREEAIKHAIL